MMIGLEMLLGAITLDYYLTQWPVVQKIKRLGFGKRKQQRMNGRKKQKSLLILPLGKLVGAQLEIY